MRDPRPPTPVGHTLQGVLSRLGDLSSDPEVARRLNAAFAKHVPGLLAFCASELRGHPHAVAEEVVQDTLFEAWDKLDTYVPDHPFRAYVWAIARLKCANVRRKRRDCLSEDGVFDPADGGTASVLDRLEREQRDALVEQAFCSALDASEQAVAHRRWVLDQPLDQIAEELSLADANEARVVLQRCKRRVGRELQRLVAGRHGHGGSLFD